MKIASFDTDFYSNNIDENTLLVLQENKYLADNGNEEYDTSSPQKIAGAAEEIRYRNAVFLRQNTWNHDGFRG